MRFKEFSIAENYDSFVQALIGNGKVGFDAFAPIDKPTQPQSTEFDNNPFNPDSKTTPQIRTDIKSGLPVKGPISSGFGRRASGMHYGTDFAVPIGTPVVAPDDGVVWQAGWGGDAGIMVAINSSNAQHKLMHLSQVKVKPGEKVKKGQVVGLSGNTGYSTGPHLHWSKYIAGKPVDPMKNVG
jgi:murein DD-endopeptidase MepM/ murein hydrolase activator NlpD